MSMASRMPLERSSSSGAGSLGVSKFRKIESFSQPALLYGMRRDLAPAVPDLVARQVAARLEPGSDAERLESCCVARAKLVVDRKRLISGDPRHELESGDSHCEARGREDISLKNVRAYDSKA